MKKIIDEIVVVACQGFAAGWVTMLFFAIAMGKHDDAIMDAAAAIACALVAMAHKP